MKTENKKTSIADLAKISTLTEEELNEANANAENNIETGSDPEEAYILEISGGESVDKPEDQPKEQSAHTSGKDRRLVHTANVICVEAKPTTEDMFRFMFRHTYFDPIGILGVLISLAAIVCVILKVGDPTPFTNAILLAVAALFLVFSPLRMYSKCKKHAEKIGRGEGIITYNFSDAGFDMVRKGEYAGFTWDQIYKVIEGKTGFYNYLSRNHAFVLPKADLGTNIEAYREMVKTHASAKAVKF